MPTQHLTRVSRFALDAFLLDAQARNLRPKTLTFYESNLRAFLVHIAGGAVTSDPLDGDAPPPGPVELGEVTTTHTRAYLAWLGGKRKLASASVRAHARALRAFFNFCENEDIIEGNPMRRVRMPRDESPEKTPFSPDDLRRLLAACKSQRDRAIVACLLDSGCRQGEFLSWRIGDVDLRTGAVHLRAAITKGRRDRAVYLGAQARRELAKLLAKDLATVGETDALWRTEAGPLKPTGLREVLKRLGKRAKVTPCNPHRFRHTFAIEFLRGGGDVFSLQGLLGHKDMTMVKKYLALTEKDLAAAHGKAGPGDRLLR